MPINPLKDFFKKRKAEIKFARAGPGQTLASSSGSSSQPGSSSSDQGAASARQAAAEAAMKRFSKDINKQSQGPRAKNIRPAPTSSATQQQPPGQPEPLVDKTAEKEVIKTLPVVDGVVQRNVQLYSTEELAQRIKQPEIDDDFFRLTVEDAKLFKLRYDEERARNEILKTSEMRRREAESKKPTTNLARLRFKLPNNMVLEASFVGDELLGVVRDWLLATCIEKSELELGNFDLLFGLRPFKGADFEKSIRQLGLLPATTLTVVQKKS